MEESARAAGEIVADCIEVNEDARALSIMPLSAPENIPLDNGVTWQRWHGPTIVNPVIVWRKIT